MRTGTFNLQWRKFVNQPGTPFFFFGVVVVVYLLSRIARTKRARERIALRQAGGLPIGLCVGDFPGT